MNTDQEIRGSDTRAALSGFDDIERFLASPDFRSWKIAEASPPLFIEPLTAVLRDRVAFIEWVRQNFRALHTLLVTHGAIVFRGFPISSAGDFNQFVMLFEQYSLGYAGGASPRQKIEGKVFEASKLAGPLKIGLHQEMAYTKDCPGRIAFFCRKPAEEGGETIIGDMRRVTRSISEGLRAKLEKYGVTSVRNFAAPPSGRTEECVDSHPDQRSWKYAFYTDDPAEVNALCAAKSMEPIWHDDGTLTVKTTFDALRSHPVTGERIYRCLLHMADPYGGVATDKLPAGMNKIVEEVFSKQKIKTGFYLGDGTPLTETEIEELVSIFDRNEISWQWQAGDIMLLDNLLVAHGRNPFSGTRDVQVGLFA